MIVVRFVGTLLALFLVVGPALSAEAPGDAKAEAKPKMTPEQHYAKDEVLYNSNWVLITTLFKDYREGRHALRSAQARGDRTSDELAGLHREMALMKGETRETERPVRLELGKARNELRKHNHILRKRAPTKPTLREIPRQPRRPAPATAAAIAIEAAVTAAAAVTGPAAATDMMICCAIGAGPLRPSGPTTTRNSRSTRWK